DQIQLARLVLAERRDVDRGVERDRRRPVEEPEDLARAEVAVHVAAERQAAPRAAIDVAAEDRAAAARVTVLGDGKGEARGVAESGVVARAARALPDAPAVVAAQRHDVDLLAR